jgi:hypothetical protein
MGVKLQVVLSTFMQSNGTMTLTTLGNSVHFRVVHKLVVPVECSLCETDGGTV